MPEVPCDGDGQQRPGTADVQGTAASFTDLLLPVRGTWVAVSPAHSLGNSPSSCAACRGLAFRSRRQCSRALCRWVVSAPT